MSSYKKGKENLKWFIHVTLPKGSTALDVGACDGEYFNLLGDWLEMDACEVFAPNITKYNLSEKYRKVYLSDIKDFKYGMYDLVIFGDVIEHMTVEAAQSVLEYAKQHSKMVIVAVPYRYKQDALYGNPFERHIQDNLTEDLFMERYPGFELKIPFPNYGYWIWQK